MIEARTTRLAAVEERAAAEAKRIARRRLQLERAERQVARKLAGVTLVGRPRLYHSDAERRAAELVRSRPRTDKARATRRAWVKANPDKVREYQRKSRIENREQRNAALCEWRAKNKDKVAEYNRRHRAKLKAKAAQS